MFKKISWIVVALVVSLAMVFISCEGEKEIENRKLVDVFDLDAHLTDTGYTAGATGTGTTLLEPKDDTMLTAAGDAVFTVISTGEGAAAKLGLKINTGSQNWGAGLDLRQENFWFYGGPDYKGDTITITGKVNAGTKWGLDANIGNNSLMVGGVTFTDSELDADGKFSKTFTLTSAEMVSLKKTNPAGIRINCKETNAEIEIYSLTVSGYRVVGGEFAAVSDIVGVPASAIIGTDLELKGTVAPAYATNQTIVWTVKSAGVTGATIEEVEVTAATEDDPAVYKYILKTTAVGEVTVTATIEGGKSKTSVYTKDFKINIIPVPTIAVKVGGTDSAATEVKLVNASFVVGAPANAYTYLVTGNYSAYSYFKVDLGAKTVADIDTITATVSIQSNYKAFQVGVAPTDADLAYGNAGSGEQQWGDESGTPKTPKQVTLNKQATFTTHAAETGEVYIMIWVHVGTDEQIMIQNVAITFTATP
jgi:hypothetical protein